MRGERRAGQSHERHIHKLRNEVTHRGLSREGQGNRFSRSHAPMPHRGHLNRDAAINFNTPNIYTSMQASELKLST